MPAITLWGVGALYFSPLLRGAVARCCRRELRDGKRFSFCTAAVPGQNSDRRARYLRSLGDLVLAHTRVERSRLAARSVGHAVGDLNGDLVTISASETSITGATSDFTPRWEDRTYDLRKLDSADIIAVYWAGKAVAHMMVSFGFQDKDYLAVSIEMRKEKGKSYSALAGFFRQYELYYVVADERDVIRVRTTIASRRKMFTSTA